MCLQPVIVDFTATWCGPCQRIGPEFVKMADEFAGAMFIKVDVDKNEVPSPASLLPLTTWCWANGGTSPDAPLHAGAGDRGGVRDPGHADLRCLQGRREDRGVSAPLPLLFPSLFQDATASAQSRNPSLCWTLPHVRALHSLGWRRHAHTSCWLNAFFGVGG